MDNCDHVLMLKMADYFPELPEIDLSMKQIYFGEQLLNVVITKYHYLSVSRRSVMSLGIRLRRIINLVATNKSRYFAQPRPIVIY